MTKRIVFGSPKREIHEAANLMFKRKIKKLPITKEDKLVGLVRLTNIARAVGVDTKLMDNS